MALPNFKVQNAPAASAVMFANNVGKEDESGYEDIAPVGVAPMADGDGDGDDPVQGLGDICPGCA